MAHSENFQVDLGGILDLLSEHLYSSPDVFIRELIQNGTDAIAARAAEDPSIRGRIVFEPDEDAGTLTVTDNGIGLSADEARAFLSKVGASIKRGGDADRTSYIGQFGVGILSCFMVADEIVVLTRRFGDDANGIRWTARPDGTYTVSELDRELDAGTRVVLKLNRRGARYAAARSVRELIDRYARYLPVDIHVGDEDWAVNDEAPPWQADLTDRHVRESLVEEFGWRSGRTALDVIDLTDESLGLRGVAFVLPDLPANASQQHHDVYLKRMFITDRPGDLLPRWAGFTRCVLCSDRLRPTASRESFYEDDTYRAVRESVTLRLRDYLQRLAVENRAVLALLLELQDAPFRQLAREDDAFFDAVIDLLTFETSVGRITFGDFRKEHSVVRVTQTSDQFRSMAALAAARGTILFNGGYTHHEELIEKAVSRDPTLTVEALDGRDLIDQLESASADAVRRFDRVRDAAAAALRPFGAAPRLAEFEPSDVPAVYAEGADSNLARSLRAAREMSQGLWKELLDAVGSGVNPEDEQTLLCLNAANPVVQSVLHAADPTLTTHTVTLLYVQALMLGQQPLTVDETRAFTDALAAVLSRSAARPGPPSAPGGHL
ncbi:MAG: HSP90 family protein [Phycisphaerales bacterium JB054]